MEPAPREKQPPRPSPLPAARTLLALSPVVEWLRRGCRHSSLDIPARDWHSESGLTTLRPCGGAAGRAKRTQFEYTERDTGVHAASRSIFCPAGSRRRAAVPREGRADFRAALRGLSSGRKTERWAVARQR